MYLEVGADILNFNGRNISRIELRQTTKTSIFLQTPALTRTSNFDIPRKSNKSERASFAQNTRELDLSPVCFNV